jgi:hypothetical protein
MYISNIVDHLCKTYVRTEKLPLFPSFKPAEGFTLKCRPWALPKMYKIMLYKKLYLLRRAIICE